MTESMEKDNKGYNTDVKEILNEISKNSFIDYEKMPKYKLFLSQVIDYLNDNFKNEKFTNNIVQNYTKSGIITKPEDGKKRGYGRLHLVELVLISYMRSILTADEIQKVFNLAFNDINDRSDDILSWEDAYKVFLKIQKESIDDYLETFSSKEEKLEELVQKFNLQDKDKERIKTFLIVLELIAEASVIKQVVQTIVADYHEEAEDNKDAD